MTKIDKPADADTALDEVRPIVKELVRGEEYVTGSRMIAYDNVGAAIGKSASWVRKLIGRSNDIGLQHFEFLNIVRAYTALCEKIEAAAAAERLRAEQLRRWADAPFESADGLVDELAEPARRDAARQDEVRS